MQSPLLIDAAGSGAPRPGWRDGFGADIKEPAHNMSASWGEGISRIDAGPVQHEWCRGRSSSWNCSVERVSVKNMLQTRGWRDDRNVCFLNHTFTTLGRVRGFKKHGHDRAPDRQRKKRSRLHQEWTRSTASQIRFWPCRQCRRGRSPVAPAVRHGANKNPLRCHCRRGPTRSNH